MWNTCTSHLLALTCQIYRDYITNGIILLVATVYYFVCAFPDCTSILCLPKPGMRQNNNSSRCNYKRRPAKQNAWRGSSQCFAEHSSLEVHMVRSTSHHLHTVKRILECAGEEPQIIIPLSKTSAMSARPELKNAYFNSKILSQIHFAVSLWC